VETAKDETYKCFVGTHWPRGT